MDIGPKNNAPDTSISYDGDALQRFRGVGALKHAQQEALLSSVNWSIAKANLAMNHFSSGDEPKIGHCRRCFTMQYCNVRTDWYFRIFMVCFDFEKVCVRGLFSIQRGFHFA